MEEDSSSTQMAGKSPNFCVLLHGSLKVEGMVALVQLGLETSMAHSCLSDVTAGHHKQEGPPLTFCLSAFSPDWFGMLYSQADSKKKSNLMMSLFEPGLEPLPWLGKISQLGPTSGK